MNKESLIQFIKFGLVGVSNFVVATTIYYIFIWFDPALYLIGSVVGGIVSIANAFFWNNMFVFRGQDKSFKTMVKKLLKTYISYGGSSLLSIFLLWVEVSVLGVSEIIAPFVNLAITTPINFVVNKYWSFKEKEND